MVGVLGLCFFQKNFTKIDVIKSWLVPTKQVGILSMLLFENMAERGITLE